MKNFDCENCDNVCHCVDCKDCKNCDNCLNCTNCTNCVDCENCHDCVGLNGQTNQSSQTGTSLPVTALRRRAEVFEETATLLEELTKAAKEGCELLREIRPVVVKYAKGE